MAIIGLFYGSDTGNTEVIVQKIIDQFGKSMLVEHDMANIRTIDVFSRYDHIIIGVPTWYDGDLQSDWDLFLEKFKTIDFSGKQVAIFGLGDQIGYGEYFVDGIGILGKVVLENNGEIVGACSTDGYDFEASEALFEHEDASYFMGLPLDEDNESELTDSRLLPWLKRIVEEFNSVAEHA